MGRAERLPSPVTPGPRPSAPLWHEASHGPERVLLRSTVLCLVLFCFPLRSGNPHDSILHRSRDSPEKAVPAKQSVPEPPTPRMPADLSSTFCLCGFHCPGHLLSMDLNTTRPYLLFLSAPFTEHGVSGLPLRDGTCQLLTPFSWPSNMPPCGRATYCLSVHPRVDIGLTSLPGDYA